ncbi:MAG: AlwI family type II restriction endonuclease [Bacteroidia bacterium]|nr:AlwI family type II restriction endonuclease [Bacteroidia bacterium]
MPKVWNIGNTTVRNPKRIENALKVFVEERFSGNAKGKQAETRIHAKLKEKGVLEFDGKPSDWNGRKWRAAFYQLGFISYEKYKIGRDTFSPTDFFKQINENNITLPYQLTEAGRKLILATTVPQIEDIYLRQFACYEIPNSLERRFADGNLKPFILFVEVLKLLDDKHKGGLTKFETGLFIQKFRNHTSSLAKTILKEILEYRAKISKCKTAKEAKKVNAVYLKDLAKFSGINPSSVVGDYADTTFRYFSLSGLFTRIGDSIVIRPNKKEFVNQLLKTEPVFLFKTKPLEYFRIFYTNTQEIPTDNIKIALNEISSLRSNIRDTANPLFKKVSTLTEKSNPETVQNVRYELIEYNNWEREEEYAYEQQESKSVTEIIKYLKVLNNEKVEGNVIIDDKPAYLEWAVWRSFLSIDDITCRIHKTRRFPVDQDFLPRNTAPGGGSDLIFEFETYILVVEVTLTTSHRQMAVESEPVKRHTAQYKHLYPTKDVYCLFIAPNIDNNVVETFRIGTWYNADIEETVNVIPMSISDFIISIETLQKKKFHNSDFKILLDNCLTYRNTSAPKWKATIKSEVESWCQKINL